MSKTYVHWTFDTTAALKSVNVTLFWVPGSPLNRYFPGGFWAQGIFVL